MQWSEAGWELLRRRGVEVPGVAGGEVEGEPGACLPRMLVRCCSVE